jgi:signal transduction histidine kinase
VSTKEQSMMTESGSASPPRDPPGNERTRRLEVALRRSLRASEGVGRLTVADTGRGIPLSIRPRLFEAFQSDKAEAGNGLGLWICKTIVDKHGGQIRWRSSTGLTTYGTVFSVSIPSEGLQEDGASASAAVL